VLRYVSAAYILYLAAGILRASYTGQAAAASRPLGFRHGLALQLSNPKVVVYAFTLFTSFLTPLAGHLALIVIAAVVLAAVAGSAACTWALCGSAIKRVLRRPRAARWVNAVLALSLAVTAVELAGVLR
jgi:threonine/homoserine/homoserine lactone efflux protein